MFSLNRYPLLLFLGRAFGGVVCNQHCVSSHEKQLRGEDFNFRSLIEKGFGLSQ